MPKIMTDDQLVLADLFAKCPNTAAKVKLADAFSRAQHDAIYGKKKTLAEYVQDAAAPTKKSDAVESALDARDARLKDAWRNK